MRIKDNLKWFFVLVVLSLLFFVVGNGVLSLTDPDEVFYAQTAKEMVQHNTWTVPYLFGQPQFEKPILLYWLLRLGFILFGVSSFGARFFPALFAAIGVIAVYFLGLYGYRDAKKAFICALVLLSSVFYVGLARTVFTDMIFSVFILLSLASLFIGYVKAEKKGAGIILFFVFCALAVLTKGPLGFLIPLLVMVLFLSLKKDLAFLRSKYFAWGLLVFLLISLPWYVLMFKKFGRIFINEFFYNDHIRRLFEAEHPGNDRWYFYPFSMIICMFPFSIYVAASVWRIFRSIKENKSQPIYLFLACWVAIVFVVFQFAHSKLTSYIFPLFPALALMAGDVIYNGTTIRQKTVYAAISWFLSFLLLVAIVVVGLIIYPAYIPSYAVIYSFIFLDTVLLLAMLGFILKRRFLLNIYALAIQIALLLLFIFLSHNSLNNYLSSKGACEYLLNNYGASNTIICSKPFLRGVRYYTNGKVAAMNAVFFSPHPIPYLNVDEQIRDFLKSQVITYGVLTKSSLGDVERTAAKNGFNVDKLKIIGNEYIVRIQPISASE